jgi:hypothetical protein
LARKVSIEPPISVRRLIDVSAAPPPRIDRFNIEPRRINKGDTITIEWLVTAAGACGVKVRLTQKKFRTDSVVSQRNGLDASGSITDRPDVDSDYFLDAQCQNGLAAPQKRLSVGVSNPTNLQFFCFKVIFPVTGICSTFAVPAASKAAAEERLRAENPTGTVTSIDCSQMATACDG